jgi:hypothetical protein
MKKIMLFIVLFISVTVQSQENNYTSFTSTKQCILQDIKNNCEGTDIAKLTVIVDKYNDVVVLNTNNYNTYYKIIDRIKSEILLVLKLRDLDNFLDRVNIVFDMADNVLYITTNEGILKCYIEDVKQF